MEGWSDIFEESNIWWDPATTSENLVQPAFPDLGETPEFDEPSISFGNAEQVQELESLNLDQSKRGWSSSDDALLLDLAGNLGFEWEKIAENFTGKSGNMVRKRWTVLNRRTTKGYTEA
jgi:hypothetical protein